MLRISGAVQVLEELGSEPADGPADQDAASPHTDAPPA